jgi:hypothetical protein
VNYTLVDLMNESVEENRGKQGKTLDTNAYVMTMSNTYKLLMKYRDNTMTL